MLPDLNILPNLNISPKLNMQPQLNVLPPPNILPQPKCTRFLPSFSEESNLLNQLGYYYQDMRDFKNYFIRNCEVDKKYEAFKVWAHWLIRNLCEIPDNYHIIPNQKIADDPDISSHLKSKGTINVKEFYNEIVKRASEIHLKYDKLKISVLNDPTKVKLISQYVKYSITYDDNMNRYHQYKFMNIYIKHNEIKHKKLISSYIGDEKSFNFYMFEVGFNYYILDGHSLQWCIPPKVFETLQTYLDVKTELFASPLNASLPMYCSLFYVDKQFSALDNFFNLDQKQILEGTFEINPPFIEKIFVKSSLMVIDFLEKSQTYNKDLLFIYIMPDWLDSGGYQRLIKSHFLIDEIIFDAYKHFYYQSSNNSMVQANFASHILVVGTQQSQSRWTDKVKNEIIKNFTCYDKKIHNNPIKENITQKESNTPKELDTLKELDTPKELDTTQID